MTRCKVKSAKARKRLQARIEAWEGIKDKTSMGGHAMHKPGSNKK